MRRKPIVPLPTGCSCRNPECQTALGFCHCGCGKQTKLARQSDSKLGYVEGKPIPFILGHNHRKKREPIRFGVIEGEPIAMIPLTRGYWAIIDAYRVNEFLDPWYAAVGIKKVYAMRRESGKVVQMHKLIIAVPCGMEVDHKNGNGLDNRESNLRLVTDLEQSWNHGVSKRNKTGITGVTWNKRCQRYAAHIKFKGKYIHLGHHDFLSDAAIARRKAEILYFGEFARQD